MASTPTPTAEPTATPRHPPTWRARHLVRRRGLRLCRQLDFDADSDGYNADSYGGADCNDSLATTTRRARHRHDGVDTDCAGNSADADSDGFDSVSYGGADCNDALHTYPGAPDTGDDADANWDGAFDYDADSDGYDSNSYGADCNDALSSTYPGAPDTGTTAWTPTVRLRLRCRPRWLQLRCLWRRRLRRQHRGQPVETEVRYDGVDADCDGLSDYDADLDGYDSDAYGGADW